jgi:hypothetical protein
MKMVSTVIHKFPLSVVGEQKIQISPGAWILSLQVQNGVPTIYAMVDPKDEKKDRDIMMYSTDKPIDNIYNHEFLGTVQLPNGFVFHYFQRVAF